MNKKIVIVGGSSGIGRKLAELYAGEGNEVCIIARRGDLLNEIQGLFPGNIFTRKIDIADLNAPSLFSDVLNEFKDVDIIIVAASIIAFNDDLSTDIEQRTIDVNVKGYTGILNTAWKYFETRGKGQIVGITSIAAARGNKQAPAYHASKGFQSLYLEGLRVKSKSRNNNITITEIIPGYLETDMGKGDRMFWVAPLDKAARQIRTAIRKKKSRAFITKRWWFIFHLQRLLPISIYDAVVNSSWKTKQKN